MFLGLRFPSHSPAVGRAIYNRKYRARRVTFNRENCSNSRLREPLKGL